MCKINLKTLWLSMALLFLIKNVYSQQIEEAVFENRSFSDIFVSLSKMADVSIISDNTVQGTASYYFNHVDFLSAFEAFLATYNLFYTVENNIYKVSRIDARYQNGLVTLKAVDMDATTLIRKLADVSGTTILIDTPPRQVVTINAENIPVESALEILIRQSPQLKIEINDDYYYVKPVKESFNNSLFMERSAIKKDNNNLYYVNIETSRFSDLIYDLFQLEGKEYALMFRGDTPIQNFRFSNKTFDELLPLLLEQGNADRVVINNIYYIFEIQRNDVTRKLRETRRLPLTYISVEHLIDLLPQNLGSPQLFRVDKLGNSILLTGSQQETAPLEQFIRMMDTPTNKKSYHRIDVKFMTTEKAGTLLTEAGAQKFVIIPGTKSLVVLTTETEYQRLKELILAADIAPDSKAIWLRYIRSKDLLEALPPSVTKEEILPALNPNLIYFNGSEEKQQQFMKDLSIIDRPLEQIKYDILVIQYQKSSSTSWNKKLNLTNATSGSASSIIGTISSMLNFKFDVIANLGLQFALNLDASVKDQQAFVMADTQLNSLSGKDVKFQNTTTFRYAQTEIDPETGKPLYSSSIKEISSGLILKLNGWMSGDGMITIDVNATVSRQGNTSAGDTNPPSTYEKVLTTQVRTPSGKPIVLGGLIQQDEETLIDRVPGVSKVPLIGKFFKDENKTKEHSEFVIYIVPHVEINTQIPLHREKEMKELYDIAKAHLS